MNVFQVSPPRGLRRFTIYLRIVLVEYLTPSSMASSSAILSSPHPGCWELIRRMKAMCSAGMRGRPGLPDFQRQYRRNPRRCQSITVAGFTKTSGDRQLCPTLDSATQKARS